MIIKDVIATLLKGQDLTPDVMEETMNEIMTDTVTDAQKAAFLTALAIKGETIDEITSAAKVMRKHCQFFNGPKNSLEIVGTGGDGANTFNISTCSFIVTAAAGYRVAKHGNRAASSRCGTADCLETLGVKIDADVTVSEKLLTEENMCFLFAQKYHPAMRFVGGVRKEIGIRTLFNILGPLANPAGTDQILLGVYDESLVEPLAHVMRNLGVVRAMVVYGMDKIDEISLSAPTKVCEVKDGRFEVYEITPEQYGLQRCQKSDLIGGDPFENAQIVRDILHGKKGPKLDVVLLNAGAAIHVADGNLSIEEGIAKAREVVESGTVLEKLEKFIAASNCEKMF